MPTTPKDKKPFVVTMGILLFLYHSDEVSGIYIMDDGTKIYWSEGRSSYMDIISPDGHRSHLCVGDPHPLNEFIQKAVEEGAYKAERQMTKAEELEYDIIRNGVIV